MGARNMVIAGDYKGKIIKNCIIFENVSWNINKTKMLPLNKDTVESYTLITEDIQKSLASGVIRGSIGEGLFGDAGMLAGALSAKNKGIYTIAINFKDGKRSLIEVDKNQYDKLIIDMF